MNNSGLALLICAVCSVFFAASLQAQSDEDMARVFEWKFAMDAPDVTFIPMEGASGWEEPPTQAKVLCMATPTPYERMAHDLRELTAETGQKVLETQSLNVDGKPGTLVLLEFEPVEGEDTETVYSIMYTCPLETGISLVVNAQYPKSQHDRLYPKMIAAFATVRKTD